jgi:hypothetical protein
VVPQGRLLRLGGQRSIGLARGVADQGGVYGAVTPADVRMYGWHLMWSPSWRQAAALA